MMTDQKTFFYYFNKTKKLIDDGTFSTVYLFHNQNQLKTYAVKKIHKKYSTNVIRELQILSYLKSLIYLKENNKENVNIVLLESFFEDNNYYFLVFPYFEGSSLYNFFNQFHFSLTELEVFFFFNQMVSIVSYLHENRVSHRDIKLENFVVNNQKELDLYLIDFGFSEIWSSPTSSITSSRSGSLLYAAPELLKNNNLNALQGEKLDIWALGVCLFLLITGNFPFFSIHDSEYTIANNIRKMFFYNLKKNTRMMSNELKSLLFQSIFILNPKKRSTCKQIKDSQWFKKLSPYFKKQKRINPFLLRMNYQSKNPCYKKYNHSCPLLYSQLSRYIDKQHTTNSS